MFSSRIFTAWYVGMMIAWVPLFQAFCSIGFLLDHWYSPAVMVLGAFVAGLTPEGGGAVAFPVLSVFLSIDRVLARDFSLMIQSIGMTSASFFILSAPNTVRRQFLPLLWFVPVCFVGFVAGMRTLQTIPVYLIQALFLSLTTTFAIAYVRGDRRGDSDGLGRLRRSDCAMLSLILFLGGICTSLFGTGADIIIYALLVTRFRMREKLATQISIVLMASMSVLGFGYRHLVDHGLAADQVQTWLCAYPVVLFMAPFGAYVLQRIHRDWMLKAVVILNVGQLLYFNLSKPSLPKLIASLVFSGLLMVAFHHAVTRLSRKEAPLPPAPGTPAKSL